MKVLNFALFGILVSMGLQAADAVSYAVNPQTSTIEWTGRKALVKSAHHGVIGLKSGSFNLSGDQITGGKFTVDMTTLAVKDLTDPTDNAKLKGHLQSDDFFDAPKFPEATFELTEATTFTAGKPTTLKGKMTIKGTTQMETIPATIVTTADGATLQSSFKINRTKYNVKFGSKAFFENLVGDRIIADEFELTVNLTATTSKVTAPATKPATVSTKK